MRNKNFKYTNKEIVKKLWFDYLCQLKLDSKSYLANFEFQSGFEIGAYLALEEGIKINNQIEFEELKNKTPSEKQNLNFFQKIKSLFDKKMHLPNKKIRTKKKKEKF